MKEVIHSVSLCCRNQALALIDLPQAAILSMSEMVMLRQL